TIPAASTPAASTPAASTPAASTPAASTPAASTPAASTPVTSAIEQATTTATSTQGGDPYIVETGATFSTIQAAVTAATIGQHIVVESSILPYTENVVINTLVHIIGVGNPTVIANNAALPVFQINTLGSGTSIQGLTIKGGIQGVLLNGASLVTLQDNTITKNGVGVDLQNNGILASTLNSIIDNTIKGNFGDQILLDGAGLNTIIGNEIVACDPLSVGVHQTASLLNIGNNVNYNSILATGVGSKAIVNDGTTLLTTLNAVRNWYGSPFNPSAQIVQATPGNVLFTPWLITNPLGNENHNGEDHKNDGKIIWRDNFCHKDGFNFCRNGFRFGCERFCCEKIRFHRFCCDRFDRFCCDRFNQFRCDRNRDDFFGNDEDGLITRNSNVNNADRSCSLRN
ncbi:MAG: right-handed parallel beta-helix repeat-containing protein, partial [Methanobacterium paludis]|nr:right-handed parallel beta-helix repeat-containing protein [Methanobacterium paludis]